MVSPRDAMETVARTVAESGKLSPDISLLLQEADSTADDADVDLPVLEITPIEVDNVSIHNTDLVGYTTDGDGNRTGRIYYSEYEMRVSLNVWTTKNDGFDPDQLGRDLREALYPHSSYGPQEPFLDDAQNPVEEITYFDLVSIERTDDLIQTPTVRRVSQEVELWAYEEFHTEKDYIVDVHFPESGDYNDSDADETISSQ